MSLSASHPHDVTPDAGIGLYSVNAILNQSDDPVLISIEQHTGTDCRCPFTNDTASAILQYLSWALDT